MLKNIVHKLNKDWLAYGVVLVFIFANTWLIPKDKIFLNLVPWALLIFVMAIQSIDKLLLLTAFLTPLSVPLKWLVGDAPNNISLPAEPILFGILLLVLFKMIRNKSFDRRIFSHPISYVIYLQLFWYLITSITSTMPIVSFKFLLARLWFVVPFFFLAAQIFKNPKNIKRYLGMYILGCAIAISLATFKHLGMGLHDYKLSNRAIIPWFNDHTAYGAALAFIIPLLVYFMLSKQVLRHERIIGFALMPLYLTGLIFSYCRAAWLSVVLAFGLSLILAFKIKKNTIIFIVMVVGAMLFLSYDTLVLQMEKNQSESSTSFSEHISSMTNVSSDASNLERINRWDCAISMFTEKPFFGWGPGTYQFQYGQFQKWRYHTIISTGLGDNGNAHSEFLGPLAEGGVFGLITALLVFLSVIITGVKVYKRDDKRINKLLVLMLLTGFASYCIHGILNNFLDTDKLSALFWPTAAAIMAIDLFSAEQDAENAPH